MSRSSPAMSDAYSEASSHYSCATDASSSSSGTFRPRRRAASGATSIGTSSTTEPSLTSDGTSYFTVGTTATEKQNRSWLDHFWAWILAEEKDPTKHVEQRQSPILERNQSSDDDDDSEGSGSSDASDLVTLEGVTNEKKNFMTLETRNDEQERHQKDVVVGFGPTYGRDASREGSQSDDYAVKRSRHRVRPPTPRYRYPTPKHSPSPVPENRVRSGPPTDADSVNDDERSNQTNSKPSSVIGTANGEIRSNNDLPPRPSSVSTFGKGRSLLGVRKTRAASPRGSNNEMRHSPSNQVAKAKSVDMSRISNGVSVKEIVQKIETAPSNTVKGKISQAPKSPQPSSTTKGQMKNVKGTRDIVSGRSAQGTSSTTSSRFRSFGARKRFGTPVFLRSASFDGVLTDDSFTSSPSRDNSYTSALEKEQVETYECRTTNDDREKSIAESRCDDAVEGSLSSQALALSAHRDTDQNNNDEHDTTTRMLVFGDKALKTTGTHKEQHWSQFSGSAAVFLSLFQEKDDETGEKNLTMTLCQPDIPRHTMSVDRHDATSRHDIQDTETSETLTERKSEALMLPRSGKRFNAVNQGRKSAQEKVLWTQLKTYRSFS